MTYEGSRGYQPRRAVGAEMDVGLGDEFRDGNVPAQMAPLTVAKAAFAAGPQTVTSYYYRGDSACHEKGLVHWLSNEKREGGPPGRIGFAMSARMSEALHAAILKVPEQEWKAYGKPSPEENRECAEVVFVPSEKSEPQDRQPLRHIALRIRIRQGDLFSDGSTVLHFAGISNCGLVAVGGNPASRTHGAEAPGFAGGVVGGALRIPLKRDAARPRGRVSGSARGERWPAPSFEGRRAGNAPSVIGREISGPTRQ